MSHQIQGYGPSRALQYAQPRQANEQQQARQAQETEAPKQTEQKTPSSTVDALAARQDLSTAEQQMIRREFPEKPEMTQRIYGANRQTQSMDAARLGRRLDVRG